MRRATTPLVLLSAAFIAAGGFIHLREWLDTYRQVPGEAPGAFVVRVGFPVNAGLSLLVAIMLVGTFVVAQRLQLVAVVAAAAFQLGSLVVLIGTRVGSVLGWRVPVWTMGADQTRAVEIGALLCLAALVVVRQLDPRPTPAAQPAHAV
jgi:hypothetical protein